MPAIDVCEPAVIRALEKAGWVVTNRPFYIRFQEPKSDYIFADLRLQQIDSEKTIIVAEVKCFEQSLLDEFYRAVGQYILYRQALCLQRIDAPIYLAVPLTVYETFFQKPVIAASVTDVQMKVIVVNLEKEEVARWIH
jgi:hypothetical protein